MARVFVCACAAVGQRTATNAKTARTLQKFVMCPSPLFMRISWYATTPGLGFHDYFEPPHNARPWDGRNLTHSFRLRGPSNSQKYIFCHVPSWTWPSSTMTI